MNTLLIAFALKDEAAPLISTLGLPRMSHHRLNLYGTGGIVCLITGTGYTRARDAVRVAICEFSPRVVINAGSAGALAQTLAVGEATEIATVSAEEKEPFVLIENENAEDYPETRLMTVTTPATDDVTRSRLAAVADCVDMEGYAIAEECARHGIECRIIKIITDSFGDTDHGKIRSAIRKLSTPLCQVVLEVILEYRESV